MESLKEGQLADSCQDNRGLGQTADNDRVSQDFSGILSLDEVEFLMDELRNCSESQDQTPQSSPSSPVKEEDSKAEAPEKIDPKQLNEEIAKGKAGEKPTLSYIALISLAIQSTPESKMVLGDIYSWVSKNFSYFKLLDRSWRNSIRHNLSLNECFIKSGRCETGKGNYWAIHPANVDDFTRGDFRRRRARIQVRKSNAIKASQRLQPNNYQTNNYGNKQLNSCSFSMYVPMTCQRMTDAAIISMFGPHVLTEKRMKGSRRSNRSNSSDNESASTSTSSSFSSTPPPSSLQCIPEPRFQSNDTFITIQPNTLSESGFHYNHYSPQVSQSPDAGFFTEVPYSLNDMCKYPNPSSLLASL